MTGSANLPPPRALVFDWDNTLIDSWRTIHHALAVTFNAMGQKPWTLDEARSRVRQSARDAFPALFGDRAEEAAAIFYKTYESDHLVALRPIAGAPRMLDVLREGEGLPLAVVSNKAGYLLRREVAHLGWDHYFSGVVGATDAARDKPAREPVEMALNGSGIAPGPQVWFVGDTDIDMHCAAAAACTGVLIRADPPSVGEFADGTPHLHVGSYDALIDAVRAARRKEPSTSGPRS